jgi:hypothetical protein
MASMTSTQGRESNGQFGSGRHDEAPEIDLASGATADIDARRTELRAEIAEWQGIDDRLARDAASHQERGAELRARLAELEWEAATTGAGSPPPNPPAWTDEPDQMGFHDSRSDLVQSGAVVDRVRVYDEDGHPSAFYRRTAGVFPEWPYQMRFQANRPLTETEKAQAAQLIGYAYRSTVAGESIGRPESDTPFSFTVSADTTKTRRDDIGMALESFETDLPGMLQHGSPVRTTDRAGAGTKGTRLVPGLNDPDLRFEIYYDSVVADA